MVDIQRGAIGLAVIISFPTSASGIIVSLKTSPKYRKNETPQKPKRWLTIFVEHGIMAHIPLLLSQ